MHTPAAAPESSEHIAVLRLGERDISLGVGRYVIGRAPSSDVVINAPTVSRRHARLTVNTLSVSIEDLDSANGVTVNGRRVRGACTLMSGDRITIGGRELEMCQFGLSPPLELTLRRNHESTDTPSDLMRVHSGTYLRAEASQTEHDGFELVGAMAERALLQGQSDEAVKVLRYRLSSVLADVKAGRAVASRVRDAALEYACKLALATRDGKWVEYALELLTVQSSACPEALVTTLLAAAQHVTVLDRNVLERYARSLRALPPSLDRIKAAQHAETLLRIVFARR